MIEETAAEEALVKVETEKTEIKVQKTITSPPDEGRVLIASGPHQGKEARLVPLPAGSVSRIPDLCLSELLTSFTFCQEFSVLLGIDDTFDSFDAYEALLSDDDVSEFRKLALRLTSVAARTRLIRESDAVDKDATLNESRTLSHLLHDLKLAPGPLLSADMTDAETVCYTVWHLVNEYSWPAIARMLIETSPECARYASVSEALHASEPGAYKVETKVALLSFLCDESCDSDTIRTYLKNKLEQVDRFQERKRKEDNAIKRIQDQAKLKSNLLARPPGDEALTEPAAAWTGQRAPEGGVDGSDLAGGSKGRAMEAMDIMRALFLKDPQPFEVKYKGKATKAVLDISAVITKIRSEGQVWVRRRLCFLVLQCTSAQSILVGDLIVIG